MKKPISKMKKIVLIILFTFLGLILACVSTFYGLLFNEINALVSIKQIDDNIFKMNYGRNYYFDDFLATGASSDEELLDFLVNRILKNLPIELSVPDFGCSSFNAVTENGDHIYARNYDWKYNPIIIVKTNPTNGYKSISTCDLNYLGFNFDHIPRSFLEKFLCLAAPYIPIDGMNEKGLSISVNMLTGAPCNQNTDKTDITTTTLIRLVLDKAANCEEAIELISNYDLHDSADMRFHYQLADKSGESVVLEYYNNEMIVVESETNYLISTNFTLNDVEDQCGFGEDRYDIAASTFESCEGIMSEDSALDLLEAVKMEWDSGGTVWSVVYNLDKLTAKYSVYGNYEKTYSFKL